MSDTTDKLISEARILIVDRGYHGFSYADLAERVGIRKASIHHHFPSKVDLVIAAVEQERAAIQAQVKELENGSPRAVDQLLAYLDYWKRCIADRSATFCLAGVLAAEIPSLPEGVATSVRGHFNDLGDWLERAMTLAAKQGAIRLDSPPDVASQFFQTTIYGAMLMARAFNDPTKFNVVVDAMHRRMRVPTLQD